MGRLPLGTDAGAAGEDVRETAGERQEGGRNVVAKTRSAKEFACELDAQIAAGKWLQEHPQFCFTSLEIRTITRKTTKKCGRPKADELVEMVYTVATKIEHGAGSVAEKRQNLGWFVLATNDRNLFPDKLLANYKEQGTVERGFRSSRIPRSG
mgnify:CR=1 FL=1